MSKNRCRGFSLIELVIVMVIISVGVLGIASQLNNNSTSLTSNEILQQAAQYAQECAERVLLQRRSNGFDSFVALDDPATTPTRNTFSCGVRADGFTNPDSTDFTRTQYPVGLKYTGSTGACPSGDICRDVSITVTSTSNNALSSSVTLMLVNY